MSHRAPAILIWLSLFSACGGGSLGPGLGGSSSPPGGPSPSIQSIQVTPSGPSITLGENQQFTATAHYSNGSSKDITGSATWASSNASVGTISGSGLATSRATGSATISATFSGVTGTATLTVTKALLVSIIVTPADAVLFPGTLQQFTATAKFSDGSSQDITNAVTWLSSDSTVASISGGGMGTALALGSVTVSATSGAITGSTTVNVENATLSSITIRPPNKQIAKLTSQQFEAIGTYTDGSTHNVTGQVAWTSSNTVVAVIGIRGLAKALVPGTTTITATLGSISATTTLVVSNATVVHITVTPSGRTIPQGTKLSFTAVGLFNDGTRQVITRDCAWASDNPAVATIGAGGNRATAVGPGTADISATFEGVSGSAKLIVSSATLSSISVTPASAVLAPTTSVQCVATGTFSDGTTQVITDLVTWGSSAPGVASVNAGGKVTAQSGGSAVITAQLGLVSGNSDIVVDASALTSIRISPSAASIPEQTGVAFVAIGTFADGNTQDLTNFALWTSSPASVATISDVQPRGHATGLTPGTATILALFEGKAGTASLTVTGAAATSQTVSPGEATESTRLVIQ